MKPLLWKDYRINRLLLIFGLVVCVGPWIIAIARNLLIEWRGGEAWWAPEFWVFVYGISLTLSLFTFAMLGGNAIAAGVVQVCGGQAALDSQNPFHCSP
jgi:hypothetical protein